MLKQILYWIRYLTADTPWDTGIVPPEIIELIEGEQIPAGQAIDLGCGTGTTSIYLARNGWQATGIDLVGRAIREARRKARRERVEGKTTFRRGDVIKESCRLDDRSFDLAVDIGCFHSLSAQESRDYAAMLKRIMRPGGTFMLYSFSPTAPDEFGYTPEQIIDLFTPEFGLNHKALGIDTAGGRQSGWYRFTRK
ncbi:MAG: class I SAM-dependent methyltransferase [Anaerolineae bacterium]|nr:class I SAM-dependent methyltransferase [Anaerolineae bacterium]